MTRSNSAIDSIFTTAKAVGSHETKGARASDAATAAYKEAGKETEANKSAFTVGYMVGALGLTGPDASAKAQAILAKKGFGTKARADARRTEKQEKAYAACRNALKRIRKAAGVIADDKRGGKRGKDSGGAAAKAKDASAKKASATMIPAFSTPHEMAAFLLAASNKNAKQFNGAEGKELQRAIAAFAKAQTAG